MTWVINFCWLSFANGIQKFDGRRFKNIGLQPGLPDDKWVNLFRCSAGNLFLSHAKGISKYEADANRFQHIYKQDALESVRPIFIGEDDEILYFFTGNGHIIGIHCTTFRKVYEVNTGLFAATENNNTNRPRIAKRIIQHKIAFLLNEKIYLWDIQNKKIVFQTPAIPSISYFFLAFNNVTEILYYAPSQRNTNLMVLDPTKNTTKLLYQFPINEVKLFRSTIHQWGEKMLLSNYNHLYEMNNELTGISHELVNFQNKPMADNAVIVSIKEDAFGNLYVVTINGGFRKIIKNNYPIKYYGSDNREQNYVLGLLADKKQNRVLIGTYGNGLLIFDTLQRLVKHIKELPGKNFSFSPNVIIKNPDGSYHLFLWGDNNIWILSNDLATLSPIPIPSPEVGLTLEGRYFGKLLYEDKHHAFIQQEYNLFKLNWKNKQVYGKKISSFSTMSGLWYNGEIVTHNNDELLFLDTTNFKLLKKIPLKNTGEVRCFAKDAASNIYVGCNKGIFKIDSTGKILFHFTRESGLPDECIYAMVMDQQGYLWCSTNKGIVRIDQKENLLHISKEHGLQENEFNTNVVSMAHDGEIFFGGINGVSSFFPDEINNLEDKISLVVTGIQVNNDIVYGDTAVWNIDELDLSYGQHSVSFDFTAFGNNNPQQYVYQYQMEGIDEEWIKNEDMKTVRYFLPPGNYVFKMTASRFFNKEATSMKEIHIRVRPPFWNTWWFKSFLGLLIFSVMVFIINQYNRKKYQKRLATLESDQKVRQERERMSRDLHDSIGAYANAVLYKTDLLQKEVNIQEREELMKDLKFASKDIITSLRETIWALKQESYSAEECLLRLRNFIQPFNRYYSHIQFTVTGEAPPTLMLHYTRALNLVRIIQEAVSNAIKHANASRIEVKSSKENGRWKLTIHDNGIGFDYKVHSELEEGNGLNNMRQRTIESAFGLTVASSKENGTLITIYV